MKRRSVACTTSRTATRGSLSARNRPNGKIRNHRMPKGPRGEPGAADRKKRDHKPAAPAHVVIAKADRRFAEADKQRTRIKADPEREVARERLRVKRATKEKPDA